MKIIKINLATYKNRAPIIIGLQGENEVRQIDLDYSKWAELYGEGAVTLAVQRYGDTSPYPLILSTADHIATWSISNTDTGKEGKGEAQVSYIVDSQVKKSDIIAFVVKHSLDDGGEIPDPYVSWLEQVQEIGVQVSDDAEAASGYAQEAEGYAREAKQAVVETLVFEDEGDGEIVITFNTEV